MVLQMSLIKAVAERNVHVREMLELKRVADKFGIVNDRVDANLSAWTAEWLDNNPRQAELLRQRCLVTIGE